jgi:glycosyltransferase involved in cell wall biosynthesis
MRIAQVCPRYSPDIGGVETHVAEISRRLVARGHDVTVLTTDPSGRLPRSEVLDGVKVLRFPAFAPGDAYYISPSLFSYLRHDRGFDIVHAHGYHALPALFASYASAKRFVFTPHYHGHGHTWLRNLLLRPYGVPGKRVFAKAGRVLCVSEYEKRLVCRDFPSACNKISIVPNGVNKADFNAVEPWPKGLKLILYVGRLEEYKGVQYAIRALKFLPWHRLLIIGKGPYKEALLQEAKAAGVQDKVAILEGQSRESLLRWYATADVFVMLSTAEAYGITVAEALSAKVPCIVAKGSALEEFVDGGSCMGVDLPIDGETLAKLIGEARFTEIPKSVLDWDQVTERLLDAYGGKP